MVFNSWTFIVFFLIVLALHQVPFSWRVKKFNLLIASYIFYAAWNPPFVLLLWFTTVVDWFMAQAIARATQHSRKRIFLIISLVSNLGLLGFFKYGGFLLESFVVAARWAGFDYHPAAPSIILPIGISFYTFVTLSYTIDVYREHIPPSKSFLDYALLVTFFPHLVAGPILRAEKFLPQCERPRRADARQMGWGWALIVIGLFEKIVLADGFLAPVADTVYGAAAKAGTTEAWLGTLAFSGQIFFDFDGYSLCAIGAAMCLGFAFPDNFRFPYAAVGFSDFWRRWHISLSTWLRDYLYVSLGGNRKGGFRTYVNLMLTMLLGGLWHGASWRFVIWGGLHGTYLVVERFLRGVLHQPAAPLPSVDNPPPAVKTPRATFNKILLALLTYFLVLITWVFFRAHSVGDGFRMIGKMFSYAPAQLNFGVYQTSLVLLITGATLICHWRLRDRSLEEVAARNPRWLTALIFAIMLFAIATAPGDNRAFIYFQF
jgi:alginate O-acetyltransferase complex protein AlgI